MGKLVCGTKRNRMEWNGMRIRAEAKRKKEEKKAVKKLAKATVTTTMKIVNAQQYKIKITMP